MSKKQKKQIQMKWYFGLLFIAVVNLLAVAPGVDVAYYNVILTLPSFAPPSWIFAPIWLINNLFVVWGNVIALNAKKSPARTKYLITQALIWINYILFPYLAFDLKVPSMFFWPTFTMLLLIIPSIYWGRKVDKRIPWSYITVIPWLLFAAYFGFRIIMLN